jgi:hypothetical protein
VFLQCKVNDLFVIISCQTEETQSLSVGGHFNADIGLILLNLINIVYLIYLSRHDESIFLFYFVVFTHHFYFM